MVADRKSTSKEKTLAKAILDRAERGRSISLSVHSRAYQMFNKGNTPTKVAIALDLMENQIIEYQGNIGILMGGTTLIEFMKKESKIFVQS
jgi:hypothetical protein